MGDAQLARTPIPVPAYFQQAEESFSLKRRWRPASQNLTPRPPVKTALPVSRVYPRRQLAWSHPRPRSVSSKGLAAVRLSSRVYDESKEDPYFEQCFQKISRLGRGSFGEVFKVRSREDGRLYAVKRSMELFRGEADRARKLAEAHRHESLGPHANLVRFVHAWEERRRLYIQTELCGASLQQYAERRAPLPERQVWAVLTDLARALKHLHDRGLAHLDVKPANVFVCGRGGARHCKLGDFGLLADLGAGGHGEAQEGDPAYMAPELLDGVYSTSADVFSLGMTILEICCNLELPRSGEAWQRLRQGDLPREFVAGLSSDLLEVLRAMLQPDFRQRISVDNLLALPALRKAQRWRGVETLLHSGISWTLALYRCLLSIMCSLWRAVSRPVTQLLLRQRHSCPASPLPSRALDAELYNDWEDSSLMNASEGPDEDDEVFGRPSKAEPLTVTLSPLHRLPEPSGHSNGKLFPEEISSRLSMGSTSTPRQTSDTQGHEREPESEPHQPGFSLQGVFPQFPALRDPGGRPGSRGSSLRAPEPAQPLRRVDGVWLRVSVLSPSLRPLPVCSRTQRRDSACGRYRGPWASFVSSRDLGARYFFRARRLAAAVFCK